MDLLIGLPILLFSAILHEVAHGYVADRLGDPTARLAGRLTLNPLKHFDLYYTLLLPLVLYILPPHIAIGGAKPVPIDEFNLRDGRKDVALVSLAGPGTNILLAIIGSVLFHVFPAGSLFFGVMITINLFLAIFNLLPIPPLDGSKLFALVLPPRQAQAYLSLGRFGIFIILILLTFPIGGFSLDTLIYTLFNFARRLLGL